MNKFLVFAFLIALLSVSSISSLYLNKKKNLKSKARLNSISKLASSKASYIKKMRQPVENTEAPRDPANEPSPFDVVLDIIKNHYEEFSRAIFSEADKDRNGEIDKSEFLEGFNDVCRRLMVPQSELRRGEELFLQGSKMGKLDERNFVELMKSQKYILVQHLEAIQFTELRVVIDLRLQAEDIQEKVHKAREQLRNNVNGPERQYFEESVKNLVQGKEFLERKDVANYLSHMFDIPKLEDGNLDIQALENQVFEQYDVNKDQKLDINEVKEIILSFDEQIAHALNEFANSIESDVRMSQMNNAPTS